MRASANNAHISGGEHLLSSDSIERALTDLIIRALASYFTPDEVFLTIEPVDPDSVTYIRSLEVRTIVSLSPENPPLTHPSPTPTLSLPLRGGGKKGGGEGKSLPQTCFGGEGFSCSFVPRRGMRVSFEKSFRISREILESNGISPVVISKAFNLLQRGPTPEGANMRGAVIMNAFTGERIEPDIRRGVRVSRIDYTEDARGLLERGLRDCGIYHERVIDALAIATKVANRIETVAEVCWSDNPDYTTGYVASKASGYVRITNMKEKGSLRGGRVFFVNPEGLKLDKYINYLERHPVIINGIGEIIPPFPLQCSAATGRGD